MSKQIFEQHVDDHGNVSVRVSDEFVVLTRDEAERLRERLDQLQAENAKLRELCELFHRLVDESLVPYKRADGWLEDLAESMRMERELGIEVG